MNVTRRQWLAGTAGGLGLMAAGASRAASSVVKVSLWDRGPDTLKATQPMRRARRHRLMGTPHGPMGISLSERTVAAGPVSFAVTNASDTWAHDLVVVRLAPGVMGPGDEPGTRPLAKLPRLGQVPALAPGHNAALTLTLSPGVYLLFSQQPGRLRGGMWTRLTAE